MSERAMQHKHDNGGKYDDELLMYLSEIRGALRMMSVITGNFYKLNEDGTISKI